MIRPQPNTKFLCFFQLSSILTTTLTCDCVLKHPACFFLYLLGGVHVDLEEIGAVEERVEEHEQALVQNVGPTSAGVLLHLEDLSG